jgi:hypothetical protein
MALSGQILLINYKCNVWRRRKKYVWTSKCNVWRSWGGDILQTEAVHSWKILDTEAWMYTGPERRTPENIHNEAREENSDDQSI